MGSNWLDRVGSVIPRGFSRQYILGLLKKRPKSGKEIIDKAILESEGIWKPSPGLIYPLLGRLLDEKLIEQTEDGRYKITLKGIGMTKDIESIHRIFQKQLEVMLRVGSVTRKAGELFKEIMILFQVEDELLRGQYITREFHYKSVR